MSESPVACPFVAWFEANQAELAEYPGEFVLVHIDLGVVAHGRSWEEFLASEADIPESERRRCMRAHTSLSVTTGRGLHDRNIKADANERARTHLARSKMSKAGLTDKSVMEEFVHAVESEREAAEISRHFNEHLRLDPDKTAMLFESTDRLIAVATASNELGSIAKRTDLPQDVSEAVARALAALRAVMCDRKERAR